MQGFLAAILKKKKKNPFFSLSGIYARSFASIVRVRGGEGGGRRREKGRKRRIEKKQEEEESGAFV